ncbi:MAG TPA: Co2+/Mg2+ efflux protein ApaG [Burkholderiaceae bacterium]|nr:Co2+/Mg2+ efflux protein ApaG [Burkholderiaceae bacterium]
MTDQENRYEIQVRAESRYLPEQSNPQQNVYAFAYTIRITNRSTIAAQLISRHWLIEDSDGQVREVKGLGVVGHQPLLNPGESFEYTSGSQIETPTGRMRGSYFFVADDGTRFEAPIPEFTLSMPRTLH